MNSYFGLFFANVFLKILIGPGAAANGSTDEQTDKSAERGDKNYKPKSHVSGDFDVGNVL